MKKPITASKLIEMLSGFPPDTPVMIECPDDFYSGPLSEDDVGGGEALEARDFTFTATNEDSRGRPVSTREYTTPAGLYLDNDNFPDEQIVRRVPCVILKID